jgi:hypothetical protein
MAQPAALKAAARTTQSENPMKKLIALAGTTLALCAACASFPVPNDQKTASESALRGAQEAGADQAPQAKLAMQLSQDEISQGNQLIQQGRNREAAAMFNRARADAELAIGLTREAQIEAESQKEAQKVAQLRATSP